MSNRYFTDAEVRDLRATQKYNSNGHEKLNMEYGIFIIILTLIYYLS